jgi:rhodanese-related sulfurtransferase
MPKAVAPAEAWVMVERREARILDLRTRAERRLRGYPPGSKPVSLILHAIRPHGRGAIYLCEHAVRSKLTLRRGALEVAGGFAAWRRQGLPVET